MTHTLVVSTPTSRPAQILVAMGPHPLQRPRSMTVHGLLEPFDVSESEPRLRHTLAFMEFPDVRVPGLKSVEKLLHYLRPPLSKRPPEWNLRDTSRLL